MKKVLCYRLHTVSTCSTCFMDKSIVSEICVVFMCADIAQDWSDHALWWPDHNMWLLRPRSTLDQYGVQADAHLHFTPMHKNLRVQLPDLQVHNLRVDFSIKCFTAVVQLCKELGKTEGLGGRGGEQQKGMGESA